MATRPKTTRATKRPAPRGPEPPMDDECVASLSCLLEDPFLDGDVEAIELRRCALAAVLALRGLDAEALL